MHCNEALLLIIRYMYLGLSVGLLAAAQTTEQCSPRFRLHPNELLNPQNRALFTGLTNEEIVANNNTDTGSRLICECTVEGLTPSYWLDIFSNVLPTDESLVVDYKLWRDDPSSTAVILRINNNGFSCTEAGTYTCVIGSNSRTLLVTPYGMNCAPTVDLMTSLINPVNTGMNVTMQCLAKNPTGSGLTYVWLQNGFQIHQALSPTLMLIGVTPKDRGTYVCRVTNRVGQGFASTFLDVIDPLLTPKDTTSSPERVTNTPEDITSISKVTAIPDETTSTVEATSPPIELTTLFEEASISSVQTTSSLHEPLATSFLSSSPHSMAASLLSPMMSGSPAPSAPETVEGPLSSSITDPSPAQSLSSSLTPFPSVYLTPPTAGIADWEIAVIVICLLVLACVIVTTVLLLCSVVYCMVAKRKGAYSMSEMEEMSKVNYVIEMEGKPSLDQNQDHSSTVAPA